MKSAGEEAADQATISAPSSPPALANGDEVNGLTSPSEETPPTPVEQSAVAIPPRETTTPSEPLPENATAATAQTLPEKSMTTSTPPHTKKLSLLADQEGPSMDVSPQDVTQAEHSLSLPMTNGFTLDSSDTSVLSPSSLSDTDLLEAVLDGGSDSLLEKSVPEEAKMEIPIAEVDQINNNSNGESCDNTISHSQETLREQGVKEECKHPGLDTPKIAPKSNKSEVTQACDVPDGVEMAEEVPASSESIKPEPKRKSFFKRSKKSNQGNRGKGHAKHKTGCVLM